MSAEILTWTFIASLYIAAFAVLQLEKHWHRTAQVFFTLATMLVLGRLVLWVWVNPEGLRGGIAFTLSITAIVATVWFVKKVEADIHEWQARKDGSGLVPERADIFTTLVIHSVQSGNVKYHLEIKNGELPVTITNITSYTSEFLHGEEGPYIPKNLRPGESLLVAGDILGKALPLDKPTNLAVRIGYNAEIRGTQKEFVSSYRFLVNCPESPCTLPPFSVSHDSELEGANSPRTEAASRFALPEGTVFLVLPEKRLDDGGPNIVTGGNTERRFIFNPETKVVAFESKAESDQILEVQLPLPETNHPQGLHLIVLGWSRTSALLRVDGVEAEVQDQKPQIE